MTNILLLPPFPPTPSIRHILAVSLIYLQLSEPVQPQEKFRTVPCYLICSVRWTMMNRQIDSGTG